MSDEPVAEQIVFAITEPANVGDMPTVLVGVPLTAWEYMADGKTHNFDLASVGIPIKFILFGAKDHSEILDVYGKLKQKITEGVPLNKDKLS